MTTRDLLLPFRKVKHLGLLGRKTGRRVLLQGRNIAYAAFDSTVPYKFDSVRHQNAWGEFPRMYFLHRPPPSDCTEEQPIPDQIFALWTGSNELTDNRRAGLESIRSCNPDREVVLVTPENLEDYIVAGHPLHEAYESLSLVHRSDYLRAYLMHHHGGGYTDIKHTQNGWGNAFSHISEDSKAWIIGYREVGSDRVGGRDARLGPELRRRYRSLAGFGAFICRPGTPLTGEWLREIERRLSYFADELAQNPGNVLGDNPGYPILWIELGMDILYPLELKYMEHVRYDDDLLPLLGGHR